MNIQDVYDILHAFIHSPHTEAALDSPDGTVYYLDLEGTLVLTKEQARALFPLFPKHPIRLEVDREMLGRTYAPQGGVGVVRLNSESVSPPPSEG